MQLPFLRNVTFVALFFFLLSSHQIFAAPKLKIAYVNMNEAINLSNEGKRSRKFLEAQANQTKQSLQKREQELRSKESDLRNMIMLSPDAKAKKEVELVEMSQKLRKAVAEAQTSFREDESRHTSKIFSDLKSVVNTVAAAGNYDLVLENSLKQTILFSKYTMIDITDEVIKRYNKLQSGE